MLGSVTGLPNRPLPALARLFPGVYYGWIVVWGTFFVSLVCVAIPFYLQPVLVASLTGLRGFDALGVSYATSSFFLLVGVFGFAIGPFVDRHGARAFIFCGALTLALALVGIGRAESAGWLALWFPLLALGFGLSTAVPTNAILTRWFIARRSIATTISQTGVSLGGAFVFPMATAMIAGWGFESAMLGLGGLICLVSLPVVIWVLRWDPLDHGLEPDGAAASAEPDDLLTRARQRRVWRRREALRTPTFWLLAAAFGLVLAAQVGMIAHQLSALGRHMSAEQAAWGGSLIPVGSVLGRFVIGPLADRVDKRAIAIGLFTLQGLGILAFSLSETPTALFASSLLFGLTIGSIFMMQSLIVAELFGIPSFGAVFGTVQLCTQIVSSGGPLLVGALVGGWGYGIALRVLVALALAGAVVLAFVRPPRAETGGAPVGSA